MRIQSREDGLSIDQIILSPATGFFFNTSPGALKNDTTIYAATQDRSRDGAPPPPPPPPPPRRCRRPGPIGDIGSGRRRRERSLRRSDIHVTPSRVPAQTCGAPPTRCSYAYQSLTGDGSIVARVDLSMSEHRRVGQGRRDDPGSLDASSAQAMMLVSYSKGLAFQRRTATGGTEHEHERRRAADRSVLGAARSSGQHDHRVSVRRRTQLDAGRHGHILDGHDRLYRARRLEPHDNVRRHREFDNVSVTNSSEG